MKVAILSYGAGGTGGVAGHTRQLERVLRERGHEVRVVSETSVPGPWRLRDLPKLWRAVSDARPERIWVQWVPHLYSARGMSLVVPLFCLLARALGRRVIVLIHEWGNPIQADRHLMAAICHRVALFLFSIGSERVFISVEVWLRKWRLRFPYCRAEWFPIASNIQPRNLGSGEARREMALPEGAFIVGCFSPATPSAVRRILEVQENLRAQSEPVHVLFFGRGTETVGLGGDLEEEEVSRAVACCDVGLLLYPDGVSARRTSAMTFLSHGIGLITNEGPLTEGFWREKGVAIFSEDSVDALTRTLKAIRKSSSAQGSRGKEVYESEFALAATFNRFAELGL